ncbi:hypothetical protein CN492_25100 [Priestia megaterium]|nr:hypothetical protein CN492_25100 [Priestia megaterium]
MKSIFITILYLIIIVGLLLIFINDFFMVNPSIFHFSVTGKLGISQYSYLAIFLAIFVLALYLRFEKKFSLKKTMIISLILCVIIILIMLILLGSVAGNI